MLPGLRIAIKNSNSDLWRVHGYRFSVVEFRQPLTVRVSIP